MYIRVLAAMLFGVFLPASPNIKIKMNFKENKSLIVRGPIGNYETLADTHTRTLLEENVFVIKREGDRRKP